MSAASITSKAFRARVQLPHHEIPILEKWCRRNCALHRIFSSDRGMGTVLIGLRAIPQSSASFSRTLRSALRKFGVSTAGLRGHWLVVIDEREAIAVCLASAGSPVKEQARTSGRPVKPLIGGDADERVVERRL